MPKKFAIATGTLSDAERDLITVFLKGKGWDFWHWLPDFWMVSGLPEECSPKILYEQIAEGTKLAQAHCVIIGLTEGPFQFWGMASSDAWPWLQKNGGGPG